ncbi:MAG: choice-of-anchor D domain-containing protein [Oscillospiraceae bacterium]|nr:choice-of-anchor D domain-containing protein [Oscillospiraceae bacterium]
MKTILKHSLAVLLVFCMLSAISLTAFAAIPSVRTDAVSGISANSATLNGYIISAPGNGILGCYGYEYCTNPSMIGATTVTWGFLSTLASIPKLISGLLQNTTYYYRAFAYASGSSGAKVYGAVCSFTTLSTTSIGSPSWWLNRTNIAFPGGSPGYGTQASMPTTVNNSGPGSLSGISASMTTGASYFEITTYPSSTLASGGVSTVSIRPRTGLPVGSYYGVLTVFSSNGGSKTMSMTFNVYASAAWSLNRTSIAFGSASVGYGTQASVQTTISNTGSVDLYATSASITTGGQYFQITEYPQNTIYPGRTSTFSVRPVTGLAPGTYSGIVTVSAGNDGSRTVSLSFTVTGAIAPAWSLSCASIMFPSAYAGYGTQASLGATIYNSGSTALSGVYATITSGGSYFEITTYPAGAISAGGYSYVYARPRTGLPAGTYYGVLSVSTSNGGSRTISLSFTVTGVVAPTWSVSPENIVYPSKTAGYATTEPATITVYNPGSVPLYGVNFAITSGGSYFEINLNIAVELGPGVAGIVFVQPRVGLPAGTYYGVLTVYTTNGGSKSVSLSFTVTGAVLPVWSLSNVSIVFPAASVGYGAQTSVPTSINNSGVVALTSVSASLTTGASYFEITGYPISTIGAGGYSSVSVRPRTGLPVGAYYGLVTVLTASAGAKTIPLEFTVTGALNPIWSLSNSNITFTPTALGYGAQSSISTSIYNSGPGALTGIGASLISGASYFEITAYPSSSIGAGSYSSVAVRPRTGLPVGTYIGVLSVSTTNGSSKTITLSFTVSTSVPVLTLNRVSITFPYAYFGYGTQTPIATIINNTGTGTLSSIYTTITTGATYFEIASSPSTSIPAGGSSSVAIRPRLGLPSGLYSGVLTVSSSNGGTQTLPLSFTVY